MDGHRGGERARGAGGDGEGAPQPDPSRSEDARDGRLRVRRPGAHPPRVALDPHRGALGPGPERRRAAPAQRQRGVDHQEGRRLARGAAAPGARPARRLGRAARRTLAREGGGALAFRVNPSVMPMPKILLVEDNEMNRDMLSRRLERKGYQVVLAVDGQSGVEMAGSHAPDLVLMDMSLPVLDGWEVTRRLKAEPRTAHLPVIALTAHAMARSEERRVGKESRTGWAADR